jgi:hypothetical protein
MSASLSTDEILIQKLLAHLRHLLIHNSTRPETMTE